jgi:hypothetical protein
MPWSQMAIQALVMLTKLHPAAKKKEVCKISFMETFRNMHILLLAFH